MEEERLDNVYIVVYHTGRTGTLVWQKADKKKGKE
ncbi:MAG: hypothetical protein G01um101472_59 [Parcubacteria group bacterium Gr01-1014_72]|nr:MAG: hypothetical protein G01um101472_59 [Parcubacteria group bacterium Gr01-1014_72]